MKKIIVGVTKDLELYYIEFENGEDYFSMTGSSLDIVEEKEGEEQARERLEDGEFWRQAVESENTELSLDDWIDLVLDKDGWESMFDFDKELGEVCFESKTYNFDFRSGGQHQEKDFEHLFIKEESLNLIMKLWDKHHLKNDIKQSFLDELKSLSIVSEELEEKRLLKAVEVITENQ